jgi:zinc transport system substrate-binding protein
VVTTVYPLEFVVDSITQGSPAVRNLVAAGAEPHDLELTSVQIDQIQDAILVVNLGNGFQPAVDEAVKGRKGPTVEILNALPINAQGRTVEDSHDHGNEPPSDPGSVDGSAKKKDGHSHDHDHGGPGEKASNPVVAPADLTNPATPLDPHVWLDPVLMRDTVKIVGDALIVAEPDQTSAYRERIALLDDELVALDAEYQNGLANCQRRTIVTAHEAFGWLAQRYNLTQYGVAGIEPDNEPSAARLAELADLARDQGVTTIFTEELVSPRVAETVAREAGGLQVATLSPLEALTPEQAQSGADYFSVMRANLAALRSALNCS